MNIKSIIFLGKKSSHGKKNHQRALKKPSQTLLSNMVTVRLLAVTSV